MKINKMKRAISMVMALAVTASSLMTYFPSYAAENETESLNEITVESTETEAAADETEAQTASENNAVAASAEESESDKQETASTQAEKETEKQTEPKTDAPVYTVTLPYYEECTYVYDEDKLKEQDADKNIILEFEADESVKITLNQSDSVLISGVHVEYAEDKDIEYKWNEETGKISFTMPEKDVWIDITFEDIAETETETEAVETETESDETKTLAAAEEAEEEEEAYGWVEYVTGEGGTISASFIYDGETYSEGTFSYDMMEYGPWEAQYETSGLVTVTAAANDGYVLQAITLTDEEGNEIESFDSETASFAPDAERRIIVTAVFAVESDEQETETESESESETEEETERLGLGGIALASDDWEGLTATRTLTGTCMVPTKLGSGGSGGRYVTFSDGFACQAFCLQAPYGSETWSGTLSMTDSHFAQLTSSRMKKALYYLYGGVAWGDTISGYNLEKIMKDDYGCTEASHYYALSHFVMSYIYMGSGSSSWYKSYWGDLNSTGIAAVEKIVDILDDMPAIKDASLSDTNVTADSLAASPTITYKASSFNTATISLPSGVGLYNVTTEKTVAAGGTAKLSGGDEFYLIGSDSVAGTTTKLSISLKYPKEYDALVYVSGDAHQDLGFFYYTSGSLSLRVTWPSDGWASVVKSTATGYEEIAAANPDATLAGAKYVIYTDEACTTVAKETTADMDAVMITIEDGSSNTVQLKPGTYYVKETEPSPGYQLDPNVYTITVVSGETATVNSEEIPENSKCYLVKTTASGYESIVANNPAYSLEGAIYGVFTDSSATVPAADVNGTTAYLTTTADGSTNTLELTPGTYYIKELTASPGYKLDATIHPVALTSGQTTSLTTEEIPVVYAPDLIVQKSTSYETDKSLKGTVFKLEFYAGATSASGSATRTWYFQSDEDGKVIFGNDSNYYLTSGSYVSQNLYYNSDNEVCVPIGYLKITEVKAPEGFDVSDTVVSYTFTKSGWTLTNGIATADGTTIIDNDKVQEAGYVNDKPVFGEVELYKEDYKTSDGSAQGDGSLEGFTFDIISQNDYTVTVDDGSEKKFSKGDVVMTLTTDADGYASSGVTIQAGTYTVVETGQNRAYTANGVNTTYTVTISSDVQKVSYTVDNEVKKGGLSIEKIDYMLDRADDQGDTDLSGAEFTIVNASVNQCENAAGNFIKSSGLSGTVTYEQVKAAINTGYAMQTITTAKDGKASTGSYDLPDGTYFVIETKAATGYQLNESWVGKVVVRENGKIYAAETVSGGTPSEKSQYTVSDQIYRSDISLTKVDKENEKAEAQGASMLEGAKFVIINASESLVKNYEGTEVPTAKNQLSNAGNPTYKELYSLYYDTGDTYVVETITTNVNGIAYSTAESLPYGTYYLIEIESSYGYWIDEEFVGKIVIRDDKVSLALGETSGSSSFTELYDSENGSTVDEPVRRNDLSFIKVDIDGEYKSYIPFLITAIAVDDEGNETEIESHVVVSDANGYVSTSSEYRSHLNNTNGFDQYVVNGVVTEEGERILAESKAGASSNDVSTWGVWFQDGCTDPSSSDDRNDNSGALYTCWYRITELQCNDNSELSENLLQSELIYIDNTSGEPYQLLSDEDTVNDEEEIYHPLVDTEIVMTSKAVDKESDTQTVAARSSVEVVESVTATHVSSDHLYRLETKFVDTTDGNKVLTIVGTNDEDAEVSDDGLWVTKEFQPSKISGTNNTTAYTTISALLDTEDLNGHTLTAVDYLYQYTPIDSTNGYWQLVARHNIEFTDADQNLYVPDLHTTATDGITGSRIGAKSEGDYILDTVEYNNLAKSEAYVIIMKVIDKATGEAIEDGKTVSSKVLYSRSDTPISGTLKMPKFTLDSSEFTGNKTLVVVESLYRAETDGTPIGEPILVHESELDEDQTIRYVDVQTSASDSETLDDVGTSSEVATVYDEVTLTNVIFDDNDLDGYYTYTVKGKLVYQQKFTDKNGVTHKAGETVETLDGTMDEVTIVSDASGNATFTYADGSTAKGTVTITGYGYNVSKSIGGSEADNAYVQDSTASIATVKVEMIYKVDSSKLEGGTVVVFEDLYHNDALVASHADITEEGQSVHYPEVQTSAAMEITGDDVGAVCEDATIVDTVILTNLVPGRTYTVNGTLVDQATGKAYLVNEKEITQSTTLSVAFDGTITASGGETVTVTGYDATYHTVNATVDMVFNFDASEMAGETLVVFEDLVHNDIVVAAHRDLTDAGQTIHFPDIQTTAKDGYTEDHVGTVTDEAVVIDVVEYENLVPGKVYTLSGVLMNQLTGEELLDANGNSITAERTFTAGKVEDGIAATTDEETNSVSGTVEITFTFDGSLLEGTTSVAFETLEHNKIPVVTHTEIHDEPQTDHFPKIRTAAIDGNVGDEVGKVSATQITDTVSLENLIPGMTYTISGILMDKATGEAVLVDDEKVTQTAEITVGEDGSVIGSNGETIEVTNYDADNNSVDCTVELIYTFDASDLAGVTTVVFEQLIHNETVVAEHCDITDLGQSVHFPEIHTTATDLDTGDHVGTVEEEAVINDAVEYTNLVVGKEYTLVGTLMNRKTGLPLLDKDGNEITSTVTFTAVAESEDERNTVTKYHEDNDSVDGTYLITFTLDASLLAGKTVVVFETLKHREVEVYTHAEITDNGQSVYYPDIHTTAVDQTTGDHVGSIWGALINFVRKAFGGGEEDAKEIITDTVSLENLVPGMTYVVSGKLYNVTESLETGEETPLVIDGKEITQAVTITVSEDGKNITASDGSKTSVTAYNEDMNSVDGTVDLTYTLDSSKIQGIELVVFEKLYQDDTYTPDTDPENPNEEDLVNEHTDIEDEGQSVSEISIHTTAVDTTTGDHVGAVPDGETTTSIHDEVNLAGLVTGMEYTIDGVLVSMGDSDFESGSIYYLKADGTLTDNRDEAYTETLTFTAEAESEVHYLNFAIASDKVQGLSLTVFENICHNGAIISSHPAGDGNGWDEEEFANQTVYYPAGKTNATDNTTDEHMSLADSNRTIVDRVYFENLLVGQEYSITGELVYKKAFTDADEVSHEAGEALGNSVTVTFTASENLTEAAYADGSGTAAVDSLSVTTMVDGQKCISGYVSISFTVDASKLAGATLVAFESFSHGEADIFTHNDLNDLPQTIKIPEIGTTANVNGIDEAAVYNADGSYADITIVDTITYKNLWTAEELASMTEQAKYIEYNDGTYRTQDNAIYTVTEDATYILKGVLMDKETGEALIDSNGNTYTVYSEPFTPESTDGSYDVTFTINAGNFLDENGETALAGKSVVVFEELYLAASKEEVTEDKKVAEHKDIEDTEQDIRIPNGRTHAVPDNGTNSLSVQNLSIETMQTLHSTEADGAHQMQSARTNIIVDYLAYENLHGNTVYTVTATLMVITETDEDGNPTAWEAAVDDEGNAITVTETLDTSILSDNYEDSVSGYIPLQFTFSALNLSGKTTVAFETVSRDGVDVIVHADINDEAQTVEITPYDITVEISKKDITNSEELPGAHLIVKDEDGNTVDEWTSTSIPHQIVNLPLGTYTLTEVTAPDGYEVAETITFEVENTIEIQPVTMYDSPKESTVDLTGKNKPGTTTSTPTTYSPVQTGDFFRYLPAVILIALAAAIVVVLIVRKRKRK